MLDLELKVQTSTYIVPYFLVGETWKWKVNLTHNGRFAADMHVFVKKQTIYWHPLNY